MENLQLLLSVLLKALDTSINILIYSYHHRSTVQVAKRKQVALGHCGHDFVIFMIFF